MIDAEVSAKLQAPVVRHCTEEKRGFPGVSPGPVFGSFLLVQKGTRVGTRNISLCSGTKGCRPEAKLHIPNQKQEKSPFSLTSVEKNDTLPTFKGFEERTVPFFVRLQRGSGGCKLLPGKREGTFRAALWKIRRRCPPLPGTKCASARREFRWNHGLCY